MKGFKYFLFEKLTLNNQSTLYKQSIEDIYNETKNKNIINYNNTVIKFISKLSGKNTKLNILKIIEIIINNTNFEGSIKITNILNQIKIALFYKTEVNSEDGYLGSVIVDTNSVQNLGILSGVGVKFQKRSYQNFGRPSEEIYNFINIMDDFIQPQNKKFKIN